MRNVLFLALLFVALVSCMNGKRKSELESDSLYEDSIWKSQYNNTFSATANNISTSAYDSLMRYTAPVESHFQGIYSGCGSIFFYKTGKKKFVVSNRHIFNGRNYFYLDSIQYEYQIDTTIVRCRKYNSNAMLEYIPMDKYSSDLNKGERFYDSGFIDLYKIEITPPSNTEELNYINALIDTSYFDKIPDSIFCFGFDGNLFDGQSPDWINTKPTLLGGIYISYYEWLSEEERVKNQKVNIAANQRFYNNMNDKYFFISSFGVTGMSGSPVFGKFPIIKNGVQGYVIKFIGVLFGLEKDTHHTWVIKAKSVYNYLK